MTTEATSGPSLPDARWRARFRRRLMNWFGRNARDLPWRRTRDPFAIWVSEIMLQQTQVETVKAYFARFLEELPDVQALAAADEQRVLRLWEGLGYYRRARQLHKAAQVIVDELGGHFPRDAAALQKLPGIGRYTAGAIASIAFDQPAPILEANTVRLFARLLAYREDPTATRGQRLLWQFSEQLVPRKKAGQFNQALMELGSLVCTPQSPDCQSCPAMALCPTFQGNLQQQIPRPKRRVQFEDIHEAAVIIRRRSGVHRSSDVLLRRCGDNERWAGLWDFPRVGVPSGSDDPAGTIATKVAEQIGGPVQLGSRLTTLKHGVTRFRITLSCYTADCDRRLKTCGIRLRWVRLEQLKDFPLSTTGRKLAMFLEREQPAAGDGDRSRPGD